MNNETKNIANDTAEQNNDNNSELEYLPFIKQDGNLESEYLPF